MPIRLKHNDSVAGWYPAVHVSVFGSGVTFPSASLPTPMRPIEARRFSR